MDSDKRGEKGTQYSENKITFSYKTDQELQATLVGKPVYLPSWALNHIVSRHVLGENIKKKKKTTFYPVGQEVNGRRLPPLMKVDELVYIIDEAVKHGKVKPGEEEVIVIYEPDNPEETGISRLKVVLRQVKGDFGVHFEVVTAYPVEGPYVPVYEEGRWVK